MLFEFFISGVLILAMCGAYQFFRAEALPRLPSRTLRRVSRQTVNAAMRSSNQKFQMALIQVREAPDFRRAASFAVQASDVPVGFRQRQFKRFRSLLVARFTQLLQSGVSADALMPGLKQLVVALGVCEFEADYIRRDAEGQMGHQAPVRPDFGQQLRDAQASHRQRMGALDGVSDLDPEVKEQLVEQEKQRFQEQMRSLSTRDDVSHVC